MSHTFRPRANCVRKALQPAKRSISSTQPRRFPEAETEASEEGQNEAEDVSNNTFLSSRSEIDAFLRAQNDIYLGKVKRNLQSLSQTATAINHILPTLANRAASIRPPSSETSPSSIPPYTASQWRKSSENIPPITQSLLSQIQRVVQNIEDLEAEPYRSDVEPSEREKLNSKVSTWSQKEKEKELLNAELKRTGMEARFLRGVERLDEGVKEMVRGREEKVQMRALARARKDGASAGAGAGDENTTSTTTTISMNADGTAVSYRPFVSSAPSAPAPSTTTTPATGTETPKTEGWGASATKVEEKGKHARTANPFQKTTTTTSTPPPATTPPTTSTSSNRSRSTSSKDDLLALRRQLDTEVEPKSLQSSKMLSFKKADVMKFEADLTAKLQAKAKAKADAEAEAKTAADSKAEADVPVAPKVRSLADLQRKMNALQGEKS